MIINQIKKRKLQVHMKICGIRLRILLPKRVNKIANRGKQNKWRKLKTPCLKKRTHSNSSLTYHNHTHMYSTQCFWLICNCKKCAKKGKVFLRICVAAKSCVFLSSRTEALEVRAGRQCADPKKLRKKSLCARAHMCKNWNNCNLFQNLLFFRNMNKNLDRSMEV